MANPITFNDTHFVRRKLHLMFTSKLSCCSGKKSIEITVRSPLALVFRVVEFWSCQVLESLSFKVVEFRVRRVLDLSSFGFFELWVRQVLGSLSFALKFWGRRVSGSSSFGFIEFWIVEFWVC